MDDLKKIVWLASYPKSGNTWFRAFLTALLNPENPEVDINNMHPTTIASSRQFFDELTGISSADLMPEEIERLRPEVYRLNAQESGTVIYHKVHDAWSHLPNGQPMFPPDITRAVLYFIRNPLDVAVSFSHHLNMDIDRTIVIMNNPEYAFCQRSDRLHNQLRQQLQTWSGHVKSWVDDSGLPVMVLRYEEMKTETQKTFSRATQFIGLDFNPVKIKAAIEICSFERLKQQETEHGFIEKNARSERFFRKGETGDWRNVLSSEQVKRIVDTHHEIMERFGYLNDVLQTTQ